MGLSARSCSKRAEKAAEKAAEIARLRDPSLRVVTFSGLTKLQWVCLKEQLRLRSVVDKRCEDNGKALVLVPPKGEGGRAWYVRKLQALLKMEFAEKKIGNDPDDLEEDDRGLKSRAARAPRQSRAQMAAPSDGDEAAASKPKQRRGRKRKAVSQPDDEDDEPEDEDDEEWAVDELLGRKLQSEEDRIPNFFFKKMASGARLASDRAYRRLRPKLRRDARFSRRI